MLAYVSLGVCVCALKACIRSGIAKTVLSKVMGGGDQLVNIGRTMKTTMPWQSFMKCAVQIRWLECAKHIKYMVGSNSSNKSPRRSLQFAPKQYLATAVVSVLNALCPVHTTSVHVEYVHQYIPTFTILMQHTFIFTQQRVFNTLVTTCHSNGC